MPPTEGDDNEREVERELPDDQDDTGDGDDTEREDGGGGDDEADDPAELSGDDPDDGEQDVDEPTRKPSRAAQRIQRQQAAVREANERAARLEREVAELRGHVQARTQTETVEQEQARLALMTPEERSEYRLTKATEQNRRDMANLQMRLEDTADRSAFEAKATIDPVYRRHAAEVEQRLTALRQQGQNIGREHLLRYIVGEKALARAAKDGNRHQRRGKEAIERERVKPGGGRGDVQTRRGKEADTPRKRLEGVII